MSSWIEKMNTSESTDAELIDIVLGRYSLNNSSEAKNFLELFFEAINNGVDEDEACNQALVTQRITNPNLIGEYKEIKNSLLVQIKKSKKIKIVSPEQETNNVTEDSFVIKDTAKLN